MSPALVWLTIALVCFAIVLTICVAILISERRERLTPAEAELVADVMRQHPKLKRDEAIRHLRAMGM